MKTFPLLYNRMKGTVTRELQMTFASQPTALNPLALASVLVLRSPPLCSRTGRDNCRVTRYESKSSSPLGWLAVLLIVYATRPAIGGRLTARALSLLVLLYF